MGVFLRQALNAGKTGVTAQSYPIRPDQATLPGARIAATSPRLRFWEWPRECPEPQLRTRCSAKSAARERGSDGDEEQRVGESTCQLADATPRDARCSGHAARAASARLFTLM